MKHISEQNLGNEATREQAEAVIKRLQALGFEVEYGDSLLDKQDDPYWPTDFDMAFSEELERIEYCTVEHGDCRKCSLVNYGRDCRNNPIGPWVATQ